MKVVIFACAVPNEDKYQFYTTISCLQGFNHLKRHTKLYFTSRQSGALLFKPLFVGDFVESRKNIILNTRNSTQFRDYNGRTSISIDKPINANFIQQKMLELKQEIINNNTYTSLNNFEESSFNELMHSFVELTNNGFSYKLKN